MNELLEAAMLVAAGIALWGLTWWLERVTRRPGLSFFIGAVTLLATAAAGFARGNWGLPLLFSIQAVGFLYIGRWRRRTSAGERP
jgi:hypothetical protein